jgi:hypothetical protein
VYYYSFDPPYFLLLASFLVSLASGVAFNAVLKQSVRDWQKNRSTRTLANLKGPQLLLPFVGIAAGAAVFLSAGVEIFGLPPKLAYGISVPMTLFIGWLVWSQLGKILVQLQEGGSQALDLDGFY